MTNRRSVHGVWLIERGSGRNMVSRAYSGIEIDMDLIAPFLSATHTFIDQASNETLRTIDTEHSRYVWEANEFLLFVMVVSKSARIGHMRFMLSYAMEEFVRTMVPANTNLGTILKNWHGAPNTFKHFGNFIDELISQYEETDESLLAGKTMDCLEVYSHLFRAILKVEVDKKTRKKIMSKIKKEAKPLIKKHPILSDVPITQNGIEVLDIDVYKLQDDGSYKTFRVALEGLLRIVALTTREMVETETFREMIFEHAMPYVKRDTARLQTYAILDDVVRYFF
ncbi:MAG: hypothetical protein RTU30_07680 [Candidatus Thorarchaeota archaeon]